MEVEYSNDQLSEGENHSGKDFGCGKKSEQALSCEGCWKQPAWCQYKKCLHQFCRLCSDKIDDNESKCLVCKETVSTMANVGYWPY